MVERSLSMREVPGSIPGASKTFANNKYGSFDKRDLHRPGIEPGPPAWQASILPLNQRCYTWKLTETHNTSKFWKCQSLCFNKKLSQLVGFEPTLPEGNWFLVSRLNHSATTAGWSVMPMTRVWMKFQCKIFALKNVGAKYRCPASSVGRAWDS